jgi:hypothetical protein
MIDLARRHKWLLSLLAIVAGNALYFLALTPVLPPWLVHQPRQLDLGVLFDLACCIGFYGLLLAYLPRK